MPQEHLKTTRRSFIKASTAFAAFSLLPSGLLANSPNGRLQVAQIGVGGRGKVNLKRIIKPTQTDLVGICDVDNLFLDEATTVVPEAKKFRDYRKLLEQLDDRLDAVLISTPDHMHAPIAKAAMLQGKHVYCEKPLAHNVSENRELNLLSQEKNLVTQLGIQNAAGLGYRTTLHYIRSGLIGKVSEVHVWSNKEW
ncbi:MAG: Gfo/Idh/MocA family oxidoreductase, partial [Verrucomicrobiota bacterium]